MAAKSWWIGCGTLAVAAVLVIVVAGVFLVQRVGSARQGLEDANARYVEVNREFPFTPPASGELDAGRFAGYLQVRQALRTALIPAIEKGSGFTQLAALSSLPGEVSRVHVQALREHSMSIDEYRWISRQVYTTVAAERSRPDGDPEVQKLSRKTESTDGGGARFSIRSRSSRDDSLNNDLLDFRWLRVPDATRDLVRAHAAELAKTVDAGLADELLMNIEFSRPRP